jgi:alpha-glucoside transport system substrate-binding protein
MKSKKIIALLSMLLVLGLALVACGGQAAAPAEEPATEAEQPAEEAAQEPTEAPMEEPAEAPMDEGMTDMGWDMMPGGYLEQALNGDFAGTTVTFDGPFADIDAVLFNESVAPFEEATGIDINYIGNKEFEGRIGIAVDGGNAPDIADFPQPGLLAGFARQGKVVDPTSFISEDWLKQQYNQSWLDMAQMEGQSTGLWHRYNAKSLVWYPKAQFEAAGYEIPETWDDLLALTQQIADDGDTAWCIGIESGAGTGWAATDWTEEMMLRTTSLENYDKWVAGTLPFSSPEVKKAIETWSEIWFNDAYVFGGTKSIVTTFFGDSPTPMFEDPPQCWLHRQGNFITSFFPEGVEPDKD